MKTRVGMVSLGCSKNQVDAERMLADMQQAGFEITNDIERCDVVIINTCGFIEAAKNESIENILTFTKLKEEGYLKVVVVTGCLAERYQLEIAKEIPQVDVVLGIGSNTELAHAIQKALEGEKTFRFAAKETLSLEGDRILTTPPYFAYLKVAEGCDNRCSYCAIPLIRGGFRSRKIEDVIEEAKTLAAQGVKELNVVAQDTTRYGEDLYGKPMLATLLNELCKIEPLQWIRILYCYPDRITDELIDTIANQPKIVKYIDVPLQHCNARILKEMNRRNDSKFLTDLMQKLRDRIPNVVLRTTMITGFPGETEAEFEELCRFVDTVRFERLGCFTYSQEEDTKAAEMPNQIEEAVKQRRAEIIMTRQADIINEINRQYQGKRLTVLVEGFDEEEAVFYGRSYMDAPDIDTKVYFTAESEVDEGDFVTVEIDSVLDYDLLGHLV